MGRNRPLAQYPLLQEVRQVSSAVQNRIDAYLSACDAVDDPIWFEKDLPVFHHTDPFQLRRTVPPLRQGFEAFDDRSRLSGSFSAFAGASLRAT